MACKAAKDVIKDNNNDNEHCNQYDALCKVLDVLVGNLLIVMTTQIKPLNGGER